MRKYLFKFKGLFALTALLTIITSAFSIGSAFIFQVMIDGASSKSSTSFLNSVKILIIFCLVTIVIDILLPIVKAVYMRKTMTYMKEDIFSSLMKKDMQCFSEENSAKYISVLSNDINMIEQDGILNIFNIIKYIFSFIMAVFYITYINIPITIAVFTTGALTFIVPQLFSKKLASKRMNYSRDLEGLTTTTKDILTGFEVVRNFNIFSKVIELYSKSNRRTEGKKQNLTIYNSLVDALADLFGTLVFAVPLVLGGYYVLKGKITAGEMVALIQLMNSIVTPLTMGVQMINKVRSLDGIFEKIKVITTESYKDTGKYELKTFNEEICLSDVDFSYDGKKKALKDINVVFEKGKKYALVGGSGSGKSTILKLLLRYYEDFDGNILFDGKEHREIGIDHIYKHLSVIQQNVFMFDGTIKDNIGLYGDYSDEEILKAAKMSGLSKLIEDLPKGIYENVGENGSRLSGGEKQRVAIARAIIKKSSVMLLDEATSSLDNETAYSIEKALIGLKDVTSIVVTHKLMEDMLLNYDEILVMRDGVIVERGKYDELISEKGYFYSLYNVAECFNEAG